MKIVGLEVTTKSVRIGAHLGANYCNAEAAGAK